VTVSEAIKALEKVPDKSVPLYFDCAHCGKALTMQKVTYAVIVDTKTGEKKL
jgi:hypothetical protein